MNNIDDPRRLFESDEAPVELRGLLERAHADVTSDAMAARLVHAVERRVEMRARSHGHGARASWAARHATKLVLAAVVAGAGGAYWASRSPGANAGHVPAPSAVPSEQPGLPADPSASHAMPATNTAEALTALRPSPVASASSPPHFRRSSPARAGRALASLQETDTAVSRGTAVGTTSVDEYHLLRAARQALADRPARALELTDEHIRRFAHGMLAQEREAIAVDALVQLGREGQARTRAQNFFASYPSSPYRSRVERAIGQAAGAATRP